MSVVQTYFIEETRELVYDDQKLEEWNEAIRKLGLQGQAKLSFSPENSPVPFEVMNQQYKNVFETLCPSKIDYKKYSKTPIPLEVLNLIALAEREKYFKSIEIWYNEKDPDPVAVGKTGHYWECSYYSDSNKELDGRKFETKQEVIDAGGNHPDLVTSGTYLIARWGAENMSMESLTELAKKRYIAQNENEARKMIRDGNRKLEDLEIEAFDKFGL